MRVVPLLALLASLIRFAAAQCPNGSRPPSIVRRSDDPVFVLAALVGDTTGAMRVYREYLDLRRFADSLLVPQRDSVAAELARLEAPSR